LYSSLSPLKPAWPRLVYPPFQPYTTAAWGHLNLPSMAVTEVAIAEQGWPHIHPGTRSSLTLTQSPHGR
jgi:hypothetical protein